VLDTLHEPHTHEELLEVHRLKTGAMIRGAVLLGCAAAGAGKDLRSAMGTYAQELGVAFQIRDDMLDVIGDEAAFGKPIGSDRADGKTTYVDVLGLERWRGYRGMSFWTSWQIRWRIGKPEG
jgi:geranylgeranyl diphosphate synthase type II